MPIISPIRNYYGILYRRCQIISLSHSLFVFQNLSLIQSIPIIRYFERVMNRRNNRIQQIYACSHLLVPPAAIQLASFPRLKWRINKSFYLAIMRIATLQFDPQVGQVNTNIEKADELLAKSGLFGGGEGKRICWFCLRWGLVVSRFFSFSLKFISLQRSVSKETSFFHLCFLRLAQLERVQQLYLKTCSLSFL